MSSSHKNKYGQQYLKNAACRKVDVWLPPCGVDAEVEAALKSLHVAEGLTASVVVMFQDLVYRFYRMHRRNLPWREVSDPWRVLVSEVMLQQTQVDRVIPKFCAFMERFPDVDSLAAASPADLLNNWQGLGYNRRALNLQRAARMIVEEWGGRVSDNPALLQQLPGIGPYTAGAVSAFAFNRPAVFLETNIRAVLLHLFFPGREGITDKELLSVTEAVLDTANPRDWYNALMDYGSDLKRRFPNPGRRSRHHTVQSRFEGSDRQLRGAVVRLLLARGAMTAAMILREFSDEAERLLRILDSLIRDGFVVRQGKRYVIPLT